MDYYEILELPRGATENEVKKAYVRMLGVCVLACQFMSLVHWLTQIPQAGHEMAPRQEQGEPSRSPA